MDGIGLVGRRGVVWRCLSGALFHVHAVVLEERGRIRILGLMEILMGLLTKRREPTVMFN